MQYRIAIVEDHLLQRKYATSLISRQQDMTVVFTGESLPEFVSWLRSSPEPKLPDLLLLDLMVDRHASANPETVKHLIDQGCSVVLFSALGSPPLVRKMVHAGVRGVLGKRDEDRNILAALRVVLDGGQWMSPELAQVISHDQQRPKLSDQEERVLILYASGLTLDAVAEAVGVKPDTAKKYLQRLKAKYAEAGRPLRSRTEIIKVAAQDGYLSFSQPYES